LSGSAMLNVGLILFNSEVISRQASGADIDIPPNSILVDFV
jgi:hypothetical protein